MFGLYAYFIWLCIWSCIKISRAKEDVKWRRFKKIYSGSSMATIEDKPSEEIHKLHKVIMEGSRLVVMSS